MLTRIAQVRCSGGDGSGDPDNICGDRNNPPDCPPPGGPPVGGPVQLEAYSDPNEKYSRITFCNGFFNLPSLTDAINWGKTKSAVDQNNLETWNSRARTFFHEATHLDYFMNAPVKSPYVSDTTFSYKLGGNTYAVEGYGPYNAKVLRNWVKSGRIGYYTQRNGTRVPPLRSDLYVTDFLVLSGHICIFCRRKVYTRTNKQVIGSTLGAICEPLI